MLLKVALLMWDYPITGVTEIRINSITDIILAALLPERERESDRHVYLYRSGIGQGS